MGDFLFIIGIVIVLVGCTALGCWYEGKDEREQREWRRDMLREHLELLKANAALRTATTQPEGTEK